MNNRHDSTPGAERHEADATRAPTMEELARLVAVEKERARSAEQRLAAQQALLDERLLRVEKNRVFSAWNAVASRIRDFRLRYGPAESDRQLLQAAHADYAAWIADEQLQLPDAEVAALTYTSWRFLPLVSIVMRSGDREDEIATLRSIAGQLYGHWDVYIEPTSAPAAPKADLPPDRLHLMSPGVDPFAFLDAIAGEYVWVVEPGDLLPPHALYYLIEALQERRHALIYADEDLHSNRRRTLPEFKPDWSPHLLASRMYIGRAFLCSVACLRQFLPVAREASKDWRRDLLLRITADGGQAHHVSRVLYHRKVHPTSIDQQQEPLKTVRKRPSGAHSTGKSVDVVICSRSSRLISSCLDSLNATAGPLINNVIVVAHIQGEANESLMRTAIERRGAMAIPFTGRFNFSLMNNLAAQSAGSPHLLFLNDDVTALHPGWLEQLVEQIDDHAAGVAGATLRYPSGLLQHAGIVAGSGDGVVHIGRNMRDSVLWPWLLDTRDVSAVTGACLCLPTALFRSLGGFDIAFPNNYNDVDLCFRARAAGRRVVCVATRGLTHAECASRQGIVRFEERYRFFRKWAAVLSRPDPYYSPHLAPTEAIQFDLAGTGGFRALLSDEHDCEG